MKQEYTSAKYWEALVDSKLHVENAYLLRRCVVPLLVKANETRSALIADGISAIEIEGEVEGCDWEDYPAGWGVDLSLLAWAMARLAEAGWPAIFILVFDESWILWQRAGTYLQGLNLVPNYDFAAFHITKAGWPPHRDRDDAAHGKQPITDGFFQDGMPKHCTLWIALSPATPETSCLYCVPKKYDPGYSTRIKGGPLASIFTTPTAFQHIVALACKQGHAWLFSHRLLHWGSSRHILASSSNHLPPLRAAFSFGSNPADMSSPFMNSSAARGQPFLSSSLHSDHATPPLEARLALAAAQFFVYARAPGDSFYPEFASAHKDSASPRHDHHRQEDNKATEIEALFLLGKRFFTPDFLGHVQAEILVQRQAVSHPRFSNSS